MSDATREELVEYFDHFEPDVRIVVKVSDLPTGQNGLIEAEHDTALREIVQVGAACPEATSILRTK